MLTTLGIRRTTKHRFTVLNKASGVLPPGRLTLLLGPPGSGKTTLLKTLAGVVKHGENNLRVSHKL